MFSNLALNKTISFDMVFILCVIIKLFFLINFLSLFTTIINLFKPPFPFLNLKFFFCI
jgi:hypothetical protein